MGEVEPEHGQAQHRAHAQLPQVRLPEVRGDSRGSTAMARSRIAKGATQVTAGTNGELSMGRVV